MQTKKRILMVNEGSHKLTGYGTYGKEVLTRLYNTNKFEIAEFASYTTVDDVIRNKATIPWKVYPNAVYETDKRYEHFKGRPDAEFGSWRFELVLLDFKPDIVFDIRDYWMFSFEQESPLRDFFHWSIMPTVDSAPQNEAWLETLTKADSVFTYSHWGQKVLEEQGQGKINLHGVASPGVDLKVFKPTKNKAAHRDRMGLDKDLNILGTVMRNQKRKLYPDLFESFAKFIDLCYEKNREDLAKKTYLYVHTGYPDNGWSIPFLLKEYGLFHKVIFTYICRNCKAYFPSFFQDARTVCKYCSHNTATMPNTQFGLTREQLADIYNLFDAYIQYSICEGFGMPQVEAIACGVPLFTVDYSAMSEVGKNSGGFNIPHKTKFLELETGAYRVYPDNDFTSHALLKFFSKPAPIRAKQGYTARACAEQFYNWDTIAKIWEHHFDNIELTGLQGKWDTKTALHFPPDKLPEGHINLTNEEFVRWLMANVLIKPELLYSHKAMEMTRALNHGFRKIGNRFVDVKREELFEGAKNKAKLNIQAQQLRMGLVQSLEQDFIQVTK